MSGILVTVGAQMPFDRLVHAVDRWARSRGRKDVFAQIADSPEPPTFIEFVRFLPPDEYRKRVEGAALVVAHAGMGSILTALELGKPLLIMPRRGDLRETRNDHQVATAKRLVERFEVAVAYDENELIARLDDSGSIRPERPIAPVASERLLEVIRNFAHGPPRS